MLSEPTALGAFEALGVCGRVYMTLRYAYLADKDVEAAAERVDAAMARAMALE